MPCKTCSQCSVVIVSHKAPQCCTDSGDFDNKMGNVYAFNVIAELNIIFEGKKVRKKHEAIDFYCRTIISACFISNMYSSINFMIH